MIKFPLSALVIVAFFNDNFSFMLLRMCLSFFHISYCNDEYYYIACKVFYIKCHLNTHTLLFCLTTHADAEYDRSLHNHS